MIPWIRPGSGHGTAVADPNDSFRHGTARLASLHGSQMSRLVKLRPRHGSHRGQMSRSGLLTR